MWREGLLAQKVLRGRTVGYRHHPQLRRFRESGCPTDAIAAYLAAVLEEARRRGYEFDPAKIPSHGAPPLLPVTEGQLEYERQHLAAKLGVRAPDLLRILQVPALESHPLFRVAPGPVESWERPGTSGEEES